MIPPKKKGPAPMVTAGTSDVTPKGLHNDNIQESSKKYKSKNLGGLTMSSSVRDLSIKVYEEQVPEGFDLFRQRVSTISPDEYWIIAIVHDKDLVADEVFVESIKKPHLHVLAIKQGRTKDNRIERRKVSSFLSVLGIVFRPDLDEEIWKNRGVETIKDLSNSVLYLTHETDKAQSEGKEIYDRSEIITNLTDDQLRDLREGYKSFSSESRRISLNDQKELASQAYKFGYEGKDWTEFEFSLPFVLQKSGGVRELFIRRYNEGMDKRVTETTDLVRLSVFIEGAHNTGKTFAATHAFDGLGLNIAIIKEGSKTGQYDRLRSTEDVLIVDDTTTNDVLGKADNRPAPLYKRNKGTPYFFGKYFIVTSNLSFDDWAKACGIKDRQLEAARSRFYICKITEDPASSRKVLYIDPKDASRRGQRSEQEERLRMFKNFRQRFNDIIGDYDPESNPIDYESELDVGFCEVSDAEASSIFANLKRQQQQVQEEESLPFN